MTADIDGYGKSGYMRGRKFDGGAESRGLSAESLRTYSESVRFFEYVRLHRCIVFIGVRLADRAAERLFGEQRALLEISAYADSYNHRRAGVAPRAANDIDNIVYNILARCGGSEHFQCAHIFAAEALGRDGKLNLIAIDKLYMQNRGYCRRYLRASADRQPQTF